MQGMYGPPFCQKLFVRGTRLNAASLTCHLTGSAQAALRRGSAALPTRRCSNQCYASAASGGAGAVVYASAANCGANADFYASAASCDANATPLPPAAVQMLLLPNARCDLPRSALPAANAQLMPPSLPQLPSIYEWPLLMPNAQYQLPLSALLAVNARLMPPTMLLPCCSVAARSAAS
jgi:hypothetical protein